MSRLRERSSAMAADFIDRLPKWLMWSDGWLSHDVCRRGKFIMEKIWSALSNDFAKAAAEAGQSVVAIHGRRHACSGVLFSNNAIVTASHAVRREEDIAVITPTGDRVKARLAGRDLGTDLAVLRTEGPVQGQVPKWGPGNDLRVGQIVLALARTWRGNMVASSGIISGLINATWRTWRGGELDQFIRPDLNFYSGFSGGPLVGSQGEFIGINTSALHRSGITIPAATVTRVAAELLEKGTVERPYLGLAMHAVPLPESLRAKLNLTASEGLLVAHVEPGGPADKAGVLLGDVLLDLDGAPVTDTEDVQEQLRAHKAGSDIEATLVRGGAVSKQRIKLEARPAR